MIGDLAQVQVRNVVGRFSRIARLNRGRRTQAWAAEAARVPQSRAKLLRRYGAFTAAIALAPFDK